MRRRPGSPSAAGEVELGLRVSPVAATAVIDAHALRHTPPGGHVHLTADCPGATLRIVVADDGEGILTEHLTHVFDRFYRVDTASWCSRAPFPSHLSRRDWDRLPAGRTGRAAPGRSLVTADFTARMSRITARRRVIRVTVGEDTMVRQDELAVEEPLEILWAVACSR